MHPCYKAPPRHFNWYEDCILYMRMKSFRKKLHRGQTALEYALIIAAVIIPLAGAVQSLLSDSKDGAHDNALQQIVTDSYGNEKRMGTIGRPYP